MILYRPVGLQELELIYDSGMEAFPARLPQQPIFYPVLELEYARQVASDWNVNSGQFAGYITEFKVEDSYIGQFEKHTVGGSQYQEFWIQAEEIEEFNRHITGHIRLLEGYFGESFQGFVPEKFGLQGKNAVEQFTLLANSFVYKRIDFYLEIRRNHKAVFLNYAFWQTHDFKNPGLKEKVIKAIKEAWFTSFPKIPLPLPPPIKEDTTPTKQTDSHAKHVVDLQEATALLEPIDSYEPRLVNPDDEDITPEELSDLDLSVEPDDDDNPSAGQNRPHSFVNPVRPEIRPGKPIAIYVPHSADTDQDDMTPEESSKSFAQQSVAPEDDDAKSVKQSASSYAVRPVHPEITPGKKTTSSSSFELEDKDVAFAKPTASHAPYSVNPDDEDITPEEPSDSFSLIDPEDEEAAFTKPRAPHSPVNHVRQEMTNRKQTTSHFVQGIRLGLSGNYHEAIDELTKAVEENPDDLVARTSLGVAFHRVREDDRALASYGAALERDPNYAEAHYFRANILYTHGNVREAIAGYTTAIGLEPELIEAHQKPIPEERLTDYNPSPAEMHRIAKPAHRILDLNKSLEIPEARQATQFKERAAEYDRLQNYEQVITDYSSALALQPNDAEALHLRGLAYEKIGQSERALEDYQQAMVINPQLSEEYIQRGITFGQMGNLRQSIASLTEGIRLAPQNADAFFNRGTSYFHLGDLENAMEDFSNVIRLAPTDEAAYYWRAVSHEEAGHTPEAIADYTQFLALSQDEAARMEIEGKLREWDKGTQSSPGAAGIAGDLSLWDKLRRHLGSRRVVPDEGQATNQVPSPADEPGPQADLYDLLAALGEQALDSTWFGSGVNCYGETAQELYAFTDDNKPIDGQDFVRIASGIRKTMEGDFQAFDPDETSPWIFIRAWEGNGFYIETNDPQAEKRLKKHFQAVEEVEGATPPYQGLFIHT